MLLGHEDVENTSKTTPYSLVGRASVPEPTALGLLGIGLAGLGFSRRKDK